MTKVRIGPPNPITAASMCSPAMSEPTPARGKTIGANISIKISLMPVLVGLEIKKMMIRIRYVMRIVEIIPAVK